MKNKSFIYSCHTLYDYLIFRGVSGIKKPIWFKRLEKSYSLNERMLYLEENISEKLEEYYESDDVGFLSS